MARIRPGYRSQSGSYRKVPVRVVLHRRAVSGEYAFESCIRIGGQKGVQETCGHGRNPRKAMASSMKFLAQKLAKRKGAFAGYGSRRKRRR